MAAPLTPGPLCADELDDIIGAPDFADRPEAEQVRYLAAGYVEQRCGRRRVLRRLTIGYGILAASAALALLGVQHVQTVQNHDQSRRTHDQAAAAAQALHDQQVVNYRFCVFVNTKVIDPIRAGIDALTVPTPTVGVTDPATLLRIANSNAGRAAARAAFEGLTDAQCGDKP